MSRDTFADFWEHLVMKSYVKAFVHSRITILANDQYHQISLSCIRHTIFLQLSICCPLFLVF